MNISWKWMYFACALGGTTWLACASSTAADDVTISKAAESVDTPLDAAPDGQGEVFYYLAKSSGAPALFRVSAGGGAPKLVHAGAPFVEPRGVVVASDDATVYVADPAANGDGVVFAVSASDGKVTPMPATAHLAPRALDLVLESGHDALYLIGGAAKDPGLFRLDPRGGDAAMIAHDMPFTEPDGIAVAADGTIFVADRQGAADAMGRVFAVTNGKTTPKSDPYLPGSPAGIALSRGGNELVISALSSDTKKSEVYVIATHDTGASMHLKKPFDEGDYSGGVHRARFVQTFAWAGKSAVYNITRKPVTSSTVGGPCDAPNQ